MTPKIRSSYQGYVDSPYKIYAGNLSWGLTSQGLREAFAEQPGFLSAKVVYDRDSGRSRGFGFITFSSAEEVESALNAMNEVVRKRLVFFFPVEPFSQVVYPRLTCWFLEMVRVGTGRTAVEVKSGGAESSSSTRSPEHVGKHWGVFKCQCLMEWWRKINFRRLHRLELSTTDAEM